MRRQSKLLAAGLVLGLFGAALVLTYVRGVEDRSGGSGPRVTALVATEPIAAGTAVDEVTGKVKSVRLPEQYARPGALVDLEAMKGQVTVRRLEAGDSLAERDFSAANQTKGRLPIPAGKEAIAVPVTLDGSVARYPVPGDHVNVFATFKTGTGVTRKMLSDVEVLATEPASAGGSAGDSGTLVYLLAVTAEQAPQVVFGKELGSISLTLVPEGQSSPSVGDVTMGGAK